MKKSDKEIDAAVIKLAKALNRCVTKEEASTEVAMGAFAMVAISVLVVVGEDELTHEYTQFIKSEYARLRDKGRA